MSQFIPGAAPAGDAGQVGAKPDDGRDLVDGVRAFLGSAGTPEQQAAITDDAFTAVETPEPYRPLADAIQRVFGQRVVFFDSTVDAQAAFGFDGDAVIVAMRLDRRRHSHRVNQIASLYGRERAPNWLADQIGSRRMLYRSERAPASPALKGL